MKNSRSRALITGLGILLIALAVAFSGSDIEYALRGTSSGALAWGPVLFRTLLACHGALLIFIGHRRSSVSRPPSPAGPTTDPLVWLMLGGLSLLAVVLRLWKLDSCLWLDEVLTMVDYARSPLGVIVTSFPNQNQHMLYSVLAHFSLGMFGESAWALRLPSVLFGVGSLWALFLLGRRLVTTREALFACALMAVSYHHLWFSQNARGYMALLFFSLIATWLWLEALSRNTWPLWFAYAWACALGAWTHMTMVFVVAAHGLTYLLFVFRTSSLENRATWRPWLAWLLFGTLTLQLHALALPEFFRQALHETSMNSEWTKPLWVVTEMVRSLRVGFSGVAALIFGAALAIAGWTGILRREPRAALVMVLPAVLGGATMIALSHNIWPRFFFFAMGFALLIFIHGAVALSSRILAPRAAAPTMAVAAVAMITLSAATLPRYYALPKQDFTGARDFVESRRQPGETVAVIGLAGHVYGRYYAPHWQTVDSVAELTDLMRKPGPVSLVYTLPIELAAFRPDLWESVKQNFEPTKVFPGTLGGGEVYVCASKHQLEPAARTVAADQNLER
jgi:hypothetical protein